METIEQPYNTAAKQEVIELVQAAQQGDRQAFDQLFRRFERAIFMVAFRRLNDYGEAQELCQEVFIQALRKIRQLQNPACFGGWLRAIAHRMAINRIVRRTPVYALETDRVESRFVENETPLGSAIAQERVDQVHNGLRRLAPLDRDTLVAFYFQGRSLVEMSDDFQSPVGTIKRRLHVARKRLAKELETVAMA
jgi:RNA polymerase sigma-70 factor (ECF subfamily)